MPYPNRISDFTPGPSYDKPEWLAENFSVHAPVWAADCDWCGLMSYGPTREYLVAEVWRHHPCPVKEEFMTSAHPDSDWAGQLARCSLGAIGLVLTREEVTYDDGTSALAWVGIQLTNRIAPRGSRWTSQHPTAVTLDELAEEANA